MALFTIENLTFTYPAAAEAVLKNINLTVNNGDFCGNMRKIRFGKIDASAPF